MGTLREIARLVMELSTLEGQQLLPVSVPLCRTRCWGGQSTRARDLPAFATHYSHGLHPAHGTAVPPQGIG